MGPTDARAFAEALGILGEAFNEPVSDIRIEAYFQALADLDGPVVLAAMRQSLRENRFFPKPVDIRELAEGGSKTVRADLAWGELIREVKRVGWARVPSFDDPGVMPTIQSVWGSWVGLCETLPNEGPELVGWMKQFKSAYQSLSVRAETSSFARLPAQLAQTLKQIADGKGMP